MTRKKIFNVLAFFMIGFGMIIGIIFPFFVLLATNVHKESVINPLFFTMTITAGIIVGFFNIFLAKRIVGAKLKELAAHMTMVEGKLLDRTTSEAAADCFSEECYMQVLTDDEIGECASSFNSLVSALQKAFSTEESVKEFSNMLSSQLELDKLSTEALKSLLNTTGALAGAIIIEKEGELLLLSSSGISSPESLIDNDAVWKVFKNKQRINIDFPDDIKLNGVLVEFRPRHIIMEPIMYKGVVLGVILIAGTKVLITEGKSNMELYTQGLSLALKNAITHDQLQTLAANDPLTGVLNRRFGLLRLEEEFSRAVRTSQPLGLLIIDIDHFKKINDTYGHLVGDKVLIQMTQTAKSALREGDVLLRYGGEEFAVVLPGASPEDSYKIAERIRRFIEDASFIHNLQNISITVSIGGTSIPTNKLNDFKEMIEEADKNLYRAKENGRNLVIVDY